MLVLAKVKGVRRQRLRGCAESILESEPRGLANKLNLSVGKEMEEKGRLTLRSWPRNWVDSDDIKRIRKWKQGRNRFAQELVVSVKVEEHIRYQLRCRL